MPPPSFVLFLSIILASAVKIVSRETDHAANDTDNSSWMVCGWSAAAYAGNGRLHEGEAEVNSQKLHDLAVAGLVWHS